MRIYLGLLLLCMSILSCKKDNITVQPVGNGKPIGAIDNRGLLRYISIAETLKLQKEPTSTEWDSLFATPYYFLAINELKFTTTDEQKEEMRTVYQQKTLSDAQKQQYEHHLEYKDNLSKLKTYAQSLEDGTMNTALKQYLYPFLPLRLQKSNYVPPIVYTYFYNKEANGLDYMIIQDAYLAFLTDTYAKGILSAHEAFHSTCAIALKNRLKLTLPSSDIRQIILNNMIGISGEGIADLIDKDKLFEPKSPVYEYFGSLRTDEKNKSIAFLKALDTEITTVSTSKKIDNANDFRQKISGFAGHLPGRYMGKAIQEANFLTEVINDVENPFVFIYAYNKSAAKLAKPNDYPILSDKTINYLKSVEAEMIKPL